jgi:3-ketosteroid 9alpha-monooxygenase subunit A
MVYELKSYERRRSVMYCHGWYKVAFERDLKSDLTPITIGPKRLVLACTDQGIRAFDADCPHRGAHLAYGGMLDGNCVICPFHRYRIGFGKDADGEFQVQEYETLVVDGIIFLRLSDSHDNGFADFITCLAEDHTLHPGFTMEIKCARPELIIENGFDNTHFRPVHGVDAAKFVPEIDELGSLRVDSTFYVKTKRPMGPQPAGAIVKTPLQLNAFSPYLSVAQLKGRRASVFITSVNPVSECTTLLRFSLALPKKFYGEHPSAKMVAGMLQGNKSGIQDDQVIWENLSLTSPPNFTAQDQAVLAFQEFCERFH